MRFLGYTLGDPNTRFPPPDPAMYEKMGAFVAEATQAGVLLATGGVKPPARPPRSSTPMASSPCLTARSPRPRS